MTIVKCSNCNKNVTVNLSRLNNRINIFCSKQCESIFKKKNNPNYYKCEVCGELTYKKPSQLKKNTHITCSVQCLNKLKQSIYKSKSNPNYGNTKHKSELWSGDDILTSSGYIKIYKPDHPLCDKYGRILEHRFNAEKIATMEQKESINGTWVLKKKLDVHHKDLCKTNNNLENLEILSRSEHAKIHADLKKRRVLKTCESCGKEFEVIVCRDQSSKFCSVKCASIGRDTRILKNCKYCGIEFLGHEDRVCCSVECSNKLNDRGTLNIECKNCKNIFSIKKSRLSKSENVFCCRKCYIEFRNKK